MNAPTLRAGYVLKVFPRLSETFILNEILELERQGVDITIFSLNPPADPRFHGKLADLKARIHYLPRPDSSQMWKQLCSFPEAAGLAEGETGSIMFDGLRRSDDAGLKTLLQGLWIASVARRERISHLHAHFVTVATRVAMHAHRLAGVSFGFTAHAKDIYHQDRDASLLGDALERASYAVTVTDYNAAWITECVPGQSHKVHRIYNGLPVDSISPAPYPNGDVPTILSVGRLVEKKGFPHLIEACRILRDQGVAYCCKIVGGGDKERPLKQSVVDAGLADHVTFLGPKSQGEVYRLLEQSHVMTLPCIIGEDGNRDALPTVLLEAMAHSRPVVSTDLPGVTEIVDSGVTGTLVPQGDSAALACALASLLGNRGRAAEYGRSGREKAERLFNIHRNVGALRQRFFDSAGIVPDGEVLETAGAPA